MVIAIIGILGALLLPALSSSEGRSRRMACLNNLRQLELASDLYAADNEGRLPENFPESQSSNSWVLGNMKIASGSTNQNLIRQSKIFPYATQVTLFHCPADRSMTGGLGRVRSYAMNGWMGSRYMESKWGRPEYRTFVRDNELAGAGPSRLWTLIDEHEDSIDDGFFLVTMDDSRPFSSFPATRHQRGYGLSFADGHVETYKLRDPGTRSPGTQVNAGNSDWMRLKAVTTIR